MMQWVLVMSHSLGIHALIATANPSRFGCWNDRPEVCRRVLHCLKTKNSRRPLLSFQRSGTPSPAETAVTTPSQKALLSKKNTCPFILPQGPTSKARDSIFFLLAFPRKSRRHFNVPASGHTHTG
ncbi:hypothetical protein DM01DRAFT_76225 [Hesseltinella vesiculosa]|uniref:Secreted protein n=1 Tax=Hesseltinella vesiculosa TaxID=101127 RepID=A0A1X2GY49_9FUNG|nr:hypothetical protein DM01DRAFT_76225 [Hesseltinella vesiculosa]